MAVYPGEQSGCQVWFGLVLRTLMNKIKLHYFNLNQEIDGSYEFILDGDQTWFTYQEIICKVERLWTSPEIFIIDFQMRKKSSITLVFIVTLVIQTILLYSNIINIYLDIHKNTF